MPADQPVSEIMSSPVLSLTQDQTIEDAVALLSERGVSGAPVVDAEGRLIGLLDDTDLILSEARLHAPTTVEILGSYFTLPGERHRFEQELRAALGQLVVDVMERDPRTVPLNATVEDVATIMLDHDVSRVPVVAADGSVAGIITRGDLVRTLYRTA